MSRSPRNQQTSPIQMSPATTPTPPVSSPLPSSPRSPSPVWDENEYGHPPQPIPFTAQTLYYGSSNKQRFERIESSGIFEEVIYKLTCEAHSVTTSQSHQVASHVRLSGRHFPKLNAAGAGRQHVQRSCHVCSKKDRSKRQEEGAGTGTKNRNWTQYHCPICNVFLHVDPCFELYHTVVEYDK
uniref:uncharacterized protein LOC120333089 n=1 Tax=Styela clava TaxID=7725 RepID=UPI0019399319|nr:uncharacterized protein LOC120333089 [Styela clava]